MLIRKNTRAFKSILGIISACNGRPDRQKFVRLYITKAGDSIKDRISVEGIQGDADLYYDLNYDAVLNNLTAPNRQLYQSDEIPGIYFFHSGSNNSWDETPFEFDASVKEEFSEVAELPVVRKKGKTEKFILPVSKIGPKTSGKATHKKRDKTGPERKDKAVPEKKKAPQPDYKLKHKFEFTDPDRNISGNPDLSKKDVLDYYNKVAEHMLPFLKGRPIGIRTASKRQEREISTHGELERIADVPDWMKSANDVLLCNDRDSLLWYAETGVVEFSCGLSSVALPDVAEYSVLLVEPPAGEFEKGIATALAAKEILSGLQVSSFVKTDGRSALHIYLPLVQKIKFETARSLAEFIARLLCLKMGGAVSLEGSDESSYGNVSLSYLVNEHENKIVAPYSLVADEIPAVAAPIPWEMVHGDLRLRDFSQATIFEVIKKSGGPLKRVLAGKTNAPALLKRLNANYSFLL